MNDKYKLPENTISETVHFAEGVTVELELETGVINERTKLNEYKSSPVTFTNITFAKNTSPNKEADEKYIVTLEYLKYPGIISRYTDPGDNCQALVDKYFPGYEITRYHWEEKEKLTFSVTDMLYQLWVTDHGIDSNYDIGRFHTMEEALAEATRDNRKQGDTATVHELAKIDDKTATAIQEYLDCEFDGDFWLVHHGTPGRWDLKNGAFIFRSNIYKLVRAFFNNPHPDMSDESIALHQKVNTAGYEHGGNNYRRSINCIVFEVPENWVNETIASLQACPLVTKVERVIDPDPKNYSLKSEDFPKE